MRRFTAIGVAALAAGVSTTALAQGAPAAAPAAPTTAQLEEIVVTAQRREESLQRTSLSLQVVTGEAIASSGAVQPNELTRLVPGLQVAGGTTSQFYVRGVGDFGVTAIANPAVAVNLDSMYIHRPQAVAGNFFDLERVEVLKGPQGTLYGRNTSGGAVNLVTVKPQLGEFGGYLAAQAGNFDMKGIEGALNLPVGENAAIRVSADLMARNGYLSDGSDDDKHQSVRLQYRYAPSDDLNLLVRGGYVHLGGKGSGYALMSRLPGMSPWTGTADPRVQTRYTSLAPPGTPPGFLRFATPNDLHQDITTWNLSAEISYDAGPVTVTLIPAWQRTEAKFNVLPSFIYGPGEFRTDGDNTETFSGELRISQQTDKFNWVAGAFYYHQDLASNFGVNSGLIQRIVLDSELPTRSYAAFGQAGYSVTDAFRLIGGLRYTSDKRELNNGEKYGVFPSGTCPSPSIAGTDRCLLARFSGEKTFKKLNWKVGFEYDLASQSMLYATASTGFKAGGFNQAVDFTPGSTNTLPFNPEEITAYTVGLKNRFLENRLQLNLEGFYWDNKDLQISQLIVDGQGQVSLATQNAGKAEIYGVSTEAVFRPYAEGTFRVGLEYVHSRYKEYEFAQAAAFVPPGSTGCAVTPTGVITPAGPLLNLDCSGFQLIRSPTWSGNASYTHSVELAGGGRLSGVVDVAFAGKRWVAPDFIPAERADAYAVWGASVTYVSPSERWMLTGFVRNITEEPLYTGGLQSSFVPGFVTASIAAPRTYGARLRVGF